MPRASCTRRPGDTASRCRGRGTYSPDASRSTSPPSPGEEPRAHGRVPRPPRRRARRPRDIDGQGMTAASMESWRFVGRRSPSGRLGSAVVACKRLHRIRRCFNHFWSISLSRP